MAFTGTEVLIYEKRGRIAYLTLNRPEVLNALNQAVGDSIIEAMDEVDRDDDILVVILSGAGGRAFSSGADLKQTSQRDAGERPARTAQEGGLTSYTALRDCRKPIIAAIDGYCLAGGFELTLMCDIRVATEQSQFGLPEPRRSLLSWTGLHNLSRMIPLGEAMRMQLTGSAIPSARAYQIGLIQAVTPDREALMREAQTIAEEIMLGAPLAVQAIKRITRIGRNVPPEYSDYLAKPIQDMVNASEDRPEGPRAFVEKRDPQWKGR